MPVSKGFKQKWIEKGYEHFALYGPENLSINKLSKEIGSPRASFYHYFGDIEVFIEELLDIHWQINQQFCSAGPFYCIMRLYGPKQEALKGEWVNPPLVGRIRYYTQTK